MDETPREELLGNRRERLFTFVLDVAILAGGSGAVAFVLAGIGLPDLAAFVLAGIAAIVSGPLFMVRVGERNGQTPGKQLVGLRVVRDDRAPMDLRTAFLRDGVFKYLAGTVTGGLFLAATAVVGAQSPDRRTLHDRAAGTFVARSENRWISAPAEVVPAPTAPARDVELEVRA